jgi:spore coat protein U-like protein
MKRTKSVGLAVLLLASIASLLGTIRTANAAAGTANFNVTATLSSACTVGAIGDLAFGTVTAFVAPPNATTTAAISCTRTLAGVTAVFDTTNGTSSAAGTTPTGAGVLDNGLNYTLSTAKGAVTSGTAATNASIGTADTFTYTITGAMAAQAGTCSSGTCVATPQARTLTLNF